MPQLEFNHNSPCLPQRGEFTYSGLDPSEMKLVQAVVNWRDAERYNSLFRQIFGRSIIYANPSPLHRIDNVPNSRYAGLQIYGAGGNMSIGLTSGAYTLSDRIPVDPVNPENHAEQLDAVLQNRGINAEGRMYAWRRPYAPLHGMDKLETDSRKSVTLTLSAYIEHNRQNGIITPFVVPELAAEGIFPDKIDPDGEPLRFQVYRVPLMPRFATQLMQKFEEVDLNGIHTYLSGVGACAGRSLKILHNLGYAYMDCHQGNMSYYKNQGSEALYITDLGSCKYVASESFRDKYFGSDFYIYLFSLNRVLTSLTERLVRSKYPGLNPTEQTKRLLHTTTTSLLYGYFAPEIETKLMNLSPSEKGNRISDDAIDFNQMLDVGIQLFIDSFAEYKSSFA